MIYDALITLSSFFVGFVAGWLSQQVYGAKAKAILELVDKK